MNSIHLVRVQAVGERLLGQMLVLEDLLEELTQAERIIREMSFTEETGILLKKIWKELREEIQTMRQMSESLLDVVQVYGKTEKKIADLYDMETTWHPKTRFGVSRMTGFIDDKYLVCLKNYFGIE